MSRLVLVSGVTEVPVNSCWTYIIFCKRCQDVIGYFSRPRDYPPRVKCPRCQSEGELCYRRKWNGEQRQLDRFVFSNINSAAGSKLLKLCLEKEKVGVKA